MAGLLRRREAVVAFSTLVLLLYWTNTLHPIARLDAPPMRDIQALSRWLPNLAYFGMGMLSAQFLKSPISDKIALAVLAGVLVAGRNLNALLLVLPFGSPVLLFWLAYTPRLRLQEWSKRTGDLSYGIYLYACPIQQCLVAYVPAVRHTLPLFFSALLLTAPCAWLSWHLVENPALKRRRKS